MDLYKKYKLQVIGSDEILLLKTDTKYPEELAYNQTGKKVKIIDLVVVDPFEYELDKKRKCVTYDDFRELESAVEAYTKKWMEY